VLVVVVLLVVQQGVGSFHPDFQIQTSNNDESEC
jgi:hypothetical protein